MIFKTARVLLALSGLLAVTALPASAQYHHGRYYGGGGDDGEFRIHVGSFRPDGSSTYWDGIRSDFTGSDPSDFENANFGLDYLLPIGRQVSLMFSGSVYEGNSSNAYRNFADNFGNRIRHDTTLDVASLTAGVVVNLTGRRSPVRPYVGAGVGLYPWRLKESGDFIDFHTANNAIFSADLRSDGTAFGYYGLVGLEVPVSRRVNLFAEGRWTKVDDNLNKDLEGLGKLDLSGREIAAGISWTL
ncbi:MAG TPA: outer membrane beta-barrel protein [Thermoanaerobaculia bacterium]|nr:outer membrane beta-barrel protein [Thermoanaerobaculia bacterium]